MSTTFLASVDLTTINCGCCGGTYAIQERFRKKKHEDGGGWHCPYCESAWGYFGETKAQKLEKQLVAANEREARERARHDQTKAELRETEWRCRAQKAAKTRIKNRVANGVCIHCNRSFANLRKHMLCKHPEEAKCE